VDRRTWWFVGAGLLVALIVAGVVSGYASSDPDGLERVAEDEGFAATAQESAAADSPLAEYGVEGIDDGRLGTGIAGVAGVVITLAATLGLFYGVRRLRGSAGNRAP
jgi:hypothetical protein